jgi:hypothetical protein
MFVIQQILEICSAVIFSEDLLALFGIQLRQLELHLLSIIQMVVIFWQHTFKVCCSGLSIILLLPFIRFGTRVVKTRFNQIIFIIFIMDWRAAVIIFSKLGVVNLDGLHPGGVVIEELSIVNGVNALTSSLSLINDLHLLRTGSLFMLNSIRIINT